MSIHAIILAAGRGTRLGQAMAKPSLPKQYLEVGGQSILRRTVELFAAHSEIDHLQLVIHPDDEVEYRRAVTGLSLPDPVYGGASRQESVFNALTRLKAATDDLVMIHDAARPFVSPATISAALAGLREGVHLHGVIAAIPLTDTLKRVEDGIVRETVPRADLWRAQTPQLFRFGAILAAHRKAIGAQLTDDAAVAEAAGLTIGIIPDSAANFKITTIEELERARQICAPAATSEIKPPASPVTSLPGTGLPRTGLGFDVHRFGPGNAVTLCGVSLPCSHGLIGHSDADVALHAVTDALLGALGAGDIGDHFPPSDPQWRGAASDIFLRHAATIAAERQAILHHVDLTLICEIPKIAPHRQAMRDNLARLLALPANAVSVKATTTEGLGFTGRREGIAAQAVVTLQIPVG